MTSTSDASSSPHPLDDLAVYALDALPPDERAAVEAHLQACATCRDEVTEHRRTLAAVVDDGEAPPDSAWEAIALRVAATSNGHSATADLPPVPTAPPVADFPPVAAAPPVADFPPVAAVPPVADFPPVPAAPPVADFPPVPAAPPVADLPPVPTAPPVAAAPTADVAAAPPVVPTADAPPADEPAAGPQVPVLAEAVLPSPPDVAEDDHAPRHLRRDGPRARRRPPRPVLAALAAAAGLVVVAALAVGLTRSGDGDGDTDGGGEATDVAAAAQDALEAPDAQVADLTSPEGEVVVRVVADEGGSGEGEGAYAVVEGLDPLPAGRAYQLWSLSGGESTSLGLLGDGTTEALAVAATEAAPDVRLAISEEPAAGVPAPTGRIVATGTFA